MGSSYVLNASNILTMEERIKLFDSPATVSPVRSPSIRPVNNFFVVKDPQNSSAMVGEKGVPESANAAGSTDNQRRSNMNIQPGPGLDALKQSITAEAGHRRASVGVKEIVPETAIFTGPTNTPFFEPAEESAMGAFLDNQNNTRDDPVASAAESAPQEEPAIESPDLAESVPANNHLVENQPVASQPADKSDVHDPDAETRPAGVNGDSDLPGCATPSPTQPIPANEDTVDHPRRPSTATSRVSAASPSPRASPLNPASPRSNTVKPASRPSPKPTASSRNVVPRAASRSAPHTTKPPSEPPTRPAQLSRLTQATAASAARRDNVANKSVAKPRPATLRPQPATKTSAIRPAPEKRPSSRTTSAVNSAPKPAEDSFLSRMMRPTAASAGRTHPKDIQSKQVAKPKQPSGRTTSSKAVMKPAGNLPKVHEAAGSQPDPVTPIIEKPVEDKHSEQSLSDGGVETMQTPVAMEDNVTR